MAGDAAARPWPPRVLCAPDKFRDATTASAAAAAMVAGAADAGWSGVAQPVADGGEGSLEAVRSRLGGVVERVQARDAAGRPVEAPYLLTDESTAIVVAADVVGLEHLEPAHRDPETSSSRGLADVVRAAVRRGVDRVVVFVGGVATVDGGLGFLAGLGADPRDAAGRPLEGRGRDTNAVAALDLASARAGLRGVEIVVATDVTSPLHGPEGAAAVFGPQKGAGPAAVERLDAGLRRLAPLLGPAAERPGAGAAGGLGAALMALGARLESGAETVLELVRFDDQLADADLCITAEGRVDAGTLAGKAVSAVLAASERASVPCVVLGGSVTPAADALYDRGAAAVLAIGREPRPLPEALAATTADLRRATRAVCSLRSGPPPRP